GPRPIPGAPGVADALPVLAGRRPAGGPGTGPPSDPTPAYQDQTRPPALSAGAANHLDRRVSAGGSPTESPAGRAGPAAGGRRGARGRWGPTPGPPRPNTPR